VFELKKLYNFTTYAPAILGGDFKQARVVALLDYDSALKYANVDLLQRQVFSKLPVGTVDAVSSYTFVLIERSDGVRVVLAYPWIIPESVVEVKTVSITATIYNADDTDMARIRDVLNTMGYQFNLVMNTTAVG
jgi:hypothetical protein